MHVPPKGYPALRRGRVSIDHSDYFLTLCAKRPCETLCSPQIVASARGELNRLETDHLCRLRCPVFMPDHWHLLLTLHAEAELSALVRLFKGRLAPVLRSTATACQPGFYDHRLRSREELLPTFLYIFLNPYRAHLCAPDISWPGYTCAPEDWAWFEPLTKQSCPEPEWLR